MTTESFEIPKAVIKKKKKFKDYELPVAIIELRDGNALEEMQKGRQTVEVHFTLETAKNTVKTLTQFLESPDVGKFPLNLIYPGTVYIPQDTVLTAD
ncbi:hypothetical protein ACFLZT_05670 [Thermodesulfobacteriota bacterium]